VAAMADVEPDRRSSFFALIVAPFRWDNLVSRVHLAPAIAGVGAASGFIGTIPRWSTTCRLGGRTPTHELAEIDRGIRTGSTSRDLAVVGVQVELAERTDGSNNIRAPLDRSLRRM